VEANGSRIGRGVLLGLSVLVWTLCTLALVGAIAAIVALTWRLVPNHALALTAVAVLVPLICGASSKTNEARRCARCLAWREKAAPLDRGWLLHFPYCISPRRERFGEGTVLGELPYARYGGVLSGRT